MKKKIITIGLWTGIFMATMIVACAITNLFFTKSHTSEFSKKKIFQFDLNTGMNGGEVGPGDSFPVSPVIFNDATEEMYVFIQVDMVTTADGVLYLFDVDDEWTPVENSNGTVVYAYGNNEMTVLSPDESTSALTSQMTMQSISNTEYAAVDDINITITGYAIGIDDVSTNPTDAWNECKTIGNIQL